MSGEKLEHFMKADLSSTVVDELKEHMLNLIEQHIEKKLNTRKMLAGAGRTGSGAGRTGSRGVSLARVSGECEAVGEIAKR